MHDDMLKLLDACIDRMLLTRERLAAARRVHPGERHTTVLAAIAAAEHFAAEATRTLTGPSADSLQSATALLPYTASRAYSLPAPHPHRPAAASSPHAGRPAAASSPHGGRSAAALSPHGGRPGAASSPQTSHSAAVVSPDSAAA